MSSIDRRGRDQQKYSLCWVQISRELPWWKGSAVGNSQPEPPEYSLLPGQSKQAGQGQNTCRCTLNALNLETTFSKLRPLTAAQEVTVLISNYHITCLQKVGGIKLLIQKPKFCCLQKSGLWKSSQHHLWRVTEQTPVLGLISGRNRNIESLFHKTA